MGYINWNEITGELNLDFLNPLLQKIEDIYKDQWKESKQELLNQDPYGSSLRDDNLLKAFQHYNSAAAKDKSDMLFQYQNALMNNKLGSRLEEMQKKYDDLMSQFQQMNQEYQQQQQAPPWLSSIMNQWNNSLQSIMNAFSQLPQNNPSSPPSQQPPPPAPIGGTILNPEVLLNYDPFGTNLPPQYNFPLASRQRTGITRGETPSPAPAEMSAYSPHDAVSNTPVIASFSPYRDISSPSGVFPSRSIPPNSFPSTNTPASFNMAAPLPLNSPPSYVQPKMQGMGGQLGAGAVSGAGKGGQLGGGLTGAAGTSGMGGAAGAGAVSGAGKGGVSGNGGTAGIPSSYYLPSGWMPPSPIKPPGIMPEKPVYNPPQPPLINTPLQPHINPVFTR